MNPDDRHLGDTLRDLVAELGELARLHIALARAELVRDARSFAIHIAPVIVGVPLLALGYVFFCVAAAEAIGLSLGVANGFLIVSVFHLLVGGVAVGFGLSRLRKPVLELSVGEELGASARSLSVQPQPTSVKRLELDDA